MADTVRQENYVEDRFNVPVIRQEELAKALAAAGTERFRIADDLTRLLVSHAFMGELDVEPLWRPTRRQGPAHGLHVLGSKNPG